MMTFEGYESNQSSHNVSQHQELLPNYSQPIPNLSVSELDFDDYRKLLPQDLHALNIHVHDQNSQMDMLLQDPLSMSSMHLNNSEEENMLTSKTEMCNLSRDLTLDESSYSPLSGLASPSLYCGWSAGAGAASTHSAGELNQTGYDCNSGFDDVPLNVHQYQALPGQPWRQQQMQHPPLQRNQQHLQLYEQNSPAENMVSSLFESGEDWRTPQYQGRSTSVSPASSYLSSHSSPSHSSTRNSSIQQGTGATAACRATGATAAGRATGTVSKRGTAATQAIPGSELHSPVTKTGKVKLRQRLPNSAYQQMTEEDRALRARVLNNSSSTRARTRKNEAMQQSSQQAMVLSNRHKDLLNDVDNLERLKTAILEHVRSAEIDPQVLQSLVNRLTQNQHGVDMEDAIHCLMKQ